MRRQLSTQYLRTTGVAAYRALKDEEGRWNTNGHRSRALEVNRPALGMFAALYDERGTPPSEARLPALHSEELLKVVGRLSEHPRRLADLEGTFFITQHWNETIAQKSGTIRRETRFPAHPTEMVFSGPHFSVGNPLYKTPREGCSSNKDYDCLDLTMLSDDYLPRTNYVPACIEEEYEIRTPEVPWTELADSRLSKVSNFYRVVSREMVGPSAERTYVAALIPRDVALIHTIVSTVFSNIIDCAEFAALSMSVVPDFFVKSTGAVHVNASMLNRLPILPPDCPTSIRNSLRVRALCLSCLTIHYAELWEKICDTVLPEESLRRHIDAFNADAWTNADPRLPATFFADLTPTWNRDVALRTDFARRQALGRGRRPHC